MSPSNEKLLDRFLRHLEDLPNWIRRVTIISRLIFTVCIPMNGLKKVEGRGDRMRTRFLESQERPLGSGWVAPAERLPQE